MSETKEPKKAPKPKKERRSASDIYAEFKGEYRKIVWPTRWELAKQTTTVIITSVIFGLIIAALDAIFSYGFNSLMNLVGA